MITREKFDKTGVGKLPGYLGKSLALYRCTQMILYAKQKSD